MKYHIENYAWRMVSSAEMLAAIIIIIIIIINRGSQETEPGLETKFTGLGFWVFPILPLPAHTLIWKTAAGRDPGSGSCPGP